jgi:uncharacterized membrane-anchored protein
MRFLPLVILGALAHLAFAAAPALEPAPAEASPAGLEFQTGTVELPAGMARLELAEGYRYLAPAEGQTVLEETGVNPPETSGEFLGLVIAPGEEPGTPGAWVAVLTYAGEGHVSDEDMARFNDAAYLEFLKAANTKDIGKRKAQGLPALELVAWASLPVYSARNRILSFSKRYWNDQARRGQESTVVRESWVLGRRGKIVVGAIAPGGRSNEMSDLNVKEIARMVQLHPGHRHEDFDPKSDRRAKWPAALQVKEAAAESKNHLSSLVRRKLPLLLLIVVAFAIKKGIDRFREA